MATGTNIEGQNSRLDQFFIRNSIILIIVELGSKLLGLILFVVLARFLGAQKTGLYSYGLAISTLFSYIPSFGFERVVQRDVGRDVSRARQLFLEIGSLKVALSLLAFAAFAAMVYFTGDEDSQILLMIVVFVLILSFNTFTNNFFRAMGHPEIEMLSRFIFSLISVGFGIWALMTGYGLAGVITAQISATATTTILSTTLLFMKTQGQKAHYSFGNLRDHIIKSAPFALNIFILYMGNQVNYVILRTLSTKVEVGYFSTAYRVFDTITLIPAAVMGAFLPLMSKLHAEASPRFDKVLRFTMRNLFIISLAVMIGTWLVGDKLIITLFGSEFAPSSLVIKLMNTSLVLSFWNFILTNLLIAKDREKMLIPLFTIGGIVHIVGNIVLISLWQAVGAAVAIIFTQGVQFLLLLYVNRSDIQRSTLFSRSLRILLSSMCMAGASVALLSYSLWLSIAAGIVVYAVALVLFRAVRRGDPSTLKQIVSQQGMTDS